MFHMEFEILNQSDVGTFGSKVNKGTICTKVRGQDIVKSDTLNSFIYSCIASFS